MPYDYDQLLPLFSSRMRRVAFAFLSESCGTSLVSKSRGTVLGEWEILLPLLLLFLLLLIAAAVAAVVAPFLAFR